MAAEKKEIKKEVLSEFVNPFDKGVSYKDFLKAMNGKNIDDYCKGKLKQDQIDWLKEDLKNLKK